MSDITAPPAPPAQAPQSQPQASQAPQQAPQEAVVSPGPNRPAPVGTQAPADQQRSNSARDAIQAAYDRAKNPPQKQARPPAKDDKPAPKAADAKAGHNQPPEETPKLDLKKRPDEQQARPRGERGQFAPRQSQEPSAVNAGQVRSGSPDQNTQNNQQYQKLPPNAPFAEPPQRISEAARRDWATTPETVRGDIHRMHQEFGRAYQQYKGAHDAFQPIARFHHMAQQHGTTLDRALNNYVSMEQKLRADPIAGLDVIVNNLNLHGPNGEKLGLRDIAYHVLSQSPEQLKMLQQGNHQQAAAQQIGALHQEINGLKQHLHQMHTQQQFVYTRSAVDQFAATHPRFDELGGVIERELNLGFPLEVAYQRAELLHPATHADQTRTTSAQTRETTDRSIHGSPDVAPSNGASRRPQKPSGSARDAVLNAVSRLNGGH